MAGNTIRFKQSAEPVIEPAPDVKVLVEHDGAGTQATLKFGEWVTVRVDGITLRLQLTQLVKKANRKPTANGKNHFCITSTCGLEHVEYVRSEERAVELFRMKHPTLEIESVRTVDS